MRASGRTTGMLIELAEYLHKHFHHGGKRTVLLVSISYAYSATLLSRLNGLFHITQEHNNFFRCGSIKIITTSYDSLNREPDRYRGIKNLKRFEDHHNPS